MPDRYLVSGGVGGRLPGVLGPDELDGRLEWSALTAGGDLVEAVAARLGSEEDAYHLLLAVLGPLRERLDGEALGAILARLPLDLARELGEAERNLGTRIAPADGADGYLAEVSRLLQRPRDATAPHVRATFAAMKAALPGDEAAAVEAALPPGVVELWRDAE